ncbi:PREDICTED: E3 ubiquitin-protein ligase RFWD3-like [Papilio xuthus]|uniref:RING-type E3 ubiquitin transferase n=1 Tax=Papilio xuthus TaxID=66420 RepID=A0A0N1IND4_PAPXU|nr:PREDICTED: E3 ubiquitin-protein ligase RFWD3-like [Papilio xuthus]KPJ05393.1 E3 ubiquitin-protein ligase RFWD3 [Papilio xuthus]
MGDSSSTPSLSPAEAEPSSPNLFEAESPPRASRRHRRARRLAGSPGTPPGAPPGAPPSAPPDALALGPASEDLLVTTNYDTEATRSDPPGTLSQYDLSTLYGNSDSVRPQSSRSDHVTPNLTNEESNSLMSLPDSKQDDSEEPPAKVRKLSSPKINDDTDGETCPICLDTWGNSGEHRLVALKCGHLFGAQCVERWLKAQPSRERTCPTCKSKAALKDIRFIYAKRLVAADSSQITALQKQVDSLQTEKSRVELELQNCKIAHRACIMQLEVLRSSLMKPQVAKEQPVRRTWRFALEKNLEISKEGGCRVMTYNCRTYELYVSQKSVNYLFPGYGIRKVSCVDNKAGQFLHLHPKPIRDLTYSQPRDLLLSAGLDGAARVVERGVPGLAVHCGLPLWSCSWDHLRTNEFYVGGVGGVVQQYDVRNPSHYIQRLTAPGDMSPVVSLRSTEYGLLSCQLNSCWLWVANMRQWEPRALPLEGPFMSLSYDEESHRALVSCRAGGGERGRLALCRVRASAPGGEVVLEPEQSFPGSGRATLMSRAAWVRAPGALWAAAHSEGEAALRLHGLEGARSVSLPAAEPALDVCALQLNGDTVLAALSEWRLRLYKAITTTT